MKMEFTFNGQTKLVNFTKPQAEIIKRLLNGERVTKINTHYMSGGDFVWYRDDNYYGWHKEYVGYKAYYNAMFEIKKAFALDRNQEEQLYSMFFVRN